MRIRTRSVAPTRRLRRGRVATVMAVFAIVLGSCGTEAEPVRPEQYVVPGDSAFPGGLAYDHASGSFFTGSTRDGTVFRGYPDDPQAHEWLPGGAEGRTTTSGLVSDDRGRLFIGGGPTNRLWIHDIGSGVLLATLTGIDGGFVNDITITPDGTAFLTDSLAHVIYRVTESSGQWQLHTWLDLTGTTVPRVDGHNLNGIAAVDETTLLAVHSMTGGLYRIDTRTSDVTEVDLGPTRLFGGDGLVVSGSDLYVVQGGLSPQNPRPQVSLLHLSSDHTSAQLRCATTHPDFLHPSTARMAEGRLLIVNSQYNIGQRNQRPELPFTITALQPPRADTCPT
ncbi:hypothetical protein [Nocardia amikacinitolerans]|uniref:hypothetical protein n=1 Tax=Nocardia amikacinitolerans TaxID=756689 RepID=UPI0012ED9CC4|nr:hypothetical protein [Nocardia amikacinitolerans]